MGQNIGRDSLRRFRGLALLADKATLRPAAGCFSLQMEVLVLLLLVLLSVPGFLHLKLHQTVNPAQNPRLARALTPPARPSLFRDPGAEAEHLPHEAGDAFQADLGLRSLGNQNPRDFWISGGNSRRTSPATS